MDWRKQYWRDLEEDYQEFMVSHRTESRGRAWEYVPGRMITLPGPVLLELVKVGWIESDGMDGFRPLRKV